MLDGNIQDSLKINFSYLKGNDMDDNEQEMDIEKIIRDFCREFSNSMIRSEAENDFRKEAVAEIAEKTNIDKKNLIYCAKTFHKQDFIDKSAEQSEMQKLYEQVFFNNNMA